MKHLIFLLAVSVFAQSGSEERMKLAMEKLQRSGSLAQQGKFAEAQTLMSEATGEIDSLVEADPENAVLRMRRGSLYAHFPDFLNKKSVAKVDLEIAAKDPKFRDQAPAMLAKISSSKPKERFQQVPASASPLIAVASVTLPDIGPLADREHLPPLLGTLMKKIESYEGFLGSHVLSSADHKGMVLIFTWWKDKHSLAAWVDGEAHQAAIRQIYSQRAPSKGGSSQVAMELLLPLPGSMQFNGGLAPKGLQK